MRKREEIWGRDCAETAINIKCAISFLTYFLDQGNIIVLICALRALERGKERESARAKRGECERESAFNACHSD